MFRVLFTYIIQVFLYLFNVIFIVIENLVSVVEDKSFYCISCLLNLFMNSYDVHLHVLFPNHMFLKYIIVVLFVFRVIHSPLSYSYSLSGYLFILIRLYNVILHL